MKNYLIILLTISSLMILESLFILTFKKQTLESLKKLSKNKYLLKKIGIAELVAGILLLLIIMTLRNI